MKKRVPVLIAVLTVSLLLSACQSGQPLSSYDLAEPILIADAGEHAPRVDGSAAADESYQPLLIAADPAATDPAATDPAVTAEAPAEVEASDIPPGTEEGGWDKWHEWEVMASLMLIANFSTKIRVDTDITDGSTIDLEDVLGLDDKGVIFRLDAFHRFTRSHRLDLSWFYISRDGNRKLEEEIEIPPDTVFPVNARLDTELDMNIIKLFYTWNFLAEEDWELGLSVGIYYVGLKTKISGEIDAGDGVIEGDGKENLNADLPLPLLGLRFNWAFAHRFRLNAWFQLMYLAIDAYKGGIFDGWLGVEWDAFDWGGFGLSYNYFNLGLEAKNEDLFNFTGKVEYSYHALLASFYVYF